MNKPKKFYLPIWFPYPSSWLKALIMLYLLIFAITIIRNFELGVYFWEQLRGSLEILVCLSIIILFLLIPIFAFAHHFLILLFRAIRQAFSKKYPDKFTIDNGHEYEYKNISGRIRTHFWSFLRILIISDCFLQMIIVSWL